MEENENLKKGAIVQLNPEICNNPRFAGCFMTVTEILSFGAQGYVQALGRNKEPGGQAYYRASWAEMELCGYAEWIIE
jgi:hypothetical protein